MQTRIYAQNKLLRSTDVDLYRRWRAADIFLTMQEIAGDHSLLLGCHMLHLLPKGMAWVLSRVTVEMQAYPHLGDEIVVKTWPGTPGHSVFPRFFIFEKPDGTRLGAASSLWLIMDLKRRRMVGAKKLDISFPDTSDLLPPVPIPGKLILPEDLPLAETRHVRYSDLDINLHMNNARYVEWVCDMFPSPIYERRAMQQLTLTYNAEIPPKAEIALHHQLQGDTFFTMGLREDTQCFAAQGVWAEGL